jgi:hypothetical protein
MLLAVAGEQKDGEADGGSSDALRQAALDAAIVHLVGESRSWLLQTEHYLDEIGSLHDERADGVVEALGMTIAEPVRPGTLRHVEQAATELLRTLTELVDVVRPQ